MSDNLTLSHKIERLGEDADAINVWVNGDELTSVEFGGTPTPSPRKMMHDLDDRESTAAQVAIAAGVEAAANNAVAAAQSARIAADGAAVVSAHAQSLELVAINIEAVQGASTNAANAAASAAEAAQSALEAAGAVPDNLVERVTATETKNTEQDGILNAHGDRLDSVESGITALSTTLIGCVIPMFAADGYVPNGCVLPDAAEYAESQFPTFYNDFLLAGRIVTCTYAEFAAQVAATGNCAKFALDTTAHKFKVPLYKDGDSITHAASAAEIGKSVKAGLPNFIANFRTLSATASSGVAYDKTVYSSWPYGTSHDGTLVRDIVIDPSRASSIYGNSNTVTDEQVRLRHFVVLASSQNNASVFDWSNYMSALAGKLNTDLDNVSAAGKSQISTAALTIGPTLSVMSTTGTWTITGCRIGVPLYIQLQGSTVSNDNGGAQIRPISGIRNSDLNGMVLGVVSATSRPNFHWLIPGSDTVLLNVYNLTASPICYLRAYQQGV